MFSIKFNKVLVFFFLVMIGNIWVSCIFFVFKFWIIIVEDWVFILFFVLINKGMKVVKVMVFCSIFFWE